MVIKTQEDYIEAIELGFKPKHHLITPNSFAAACYDQGDLCDLLGAIRGGFEEWRWEPWDITYIEWLDSIIEAIEVSMYEFKESDDWEGDE